MKLKRNLLSPLLKNLAPLARVKTTLPLFNYIRMQAQGDKLCLSVTNGAEGIQTLYPEPVTEALDVFVPTLFADDLNKSASEEVELTLTKNKLVAKMGGIKSTYSVLDNEDGLWPTFEIESGKKHYVFAEHFAKGVEVAGMAITNNTPEHISAAPQRGNVCLRLGATNTFAGVYENGFTEYSFEGDDDQNIQILFPYNAAKDLLGFLGEMVAIIETPTRVYFQSDKTVLWAGKTASVFASYWKAFPITFQTLDLPYEQMNEFLSRANRMMKDGGGVPVFFVLETGDTGLYALYEGEKGSVDVLFGGQWQPFRLGVNVEVFNKFYDKNSVMIIGENGMICTATREGNVRTLQTSFAL